MSYFMICAQCGNQFPYAPKQAANRKYCSIRCKMTAHDRRRRPPTPDAVYAASPTDWAYLAGIIDGEGTIAIGASGKRHVKAYISVANTSTMLLQWLQQMFGGSVHHKRQRKPQHKAIARWELIALRDIRPLLRGVMPYLVLKMPQARLLSQFAEQGTHGQSGASGKAHALSDDELSRRRDLKQQMHELNRRGVAIP